MELISERPQVISGALYGKRFYSHTGGNAAQYRDQRFLQDTFFPFDRKQVAADTNDCLVHAVNFAFRYPIFLDRAQVVRLMKKRGHYTLEVTMRDKAQFGVPLSAMRDFVLLDNIAYSLEPLQLSFTLMSAEGTVGSLRRYLSQHLGTGEGQHKQLILTGTTYGIATGYSHASALLAFPNRDGYVFVQSQDHPGGVWGDKAPRTEALTTTAKLSELFGHYHELQLFKIVGREVSGEERVKLERELGFVMSGN